MIIGAGLAGLTAGTRLVANGTLAPDELLIVDDGPEVGGRLATAHLGGATLDHGAQFFTVRSEELASDVDRWLALGVVEEWCRGFGVPDGYPRYRVRGGMQALARHLAEGLIGAGVTIAVGVSVATVDIDGDRWRLAYGDGDGGADGVRPVDRAAAVIATPPAPATAALLSPAVLAAATATGRAVLDDHPYHRVVAILTVLDGRSPLPDPGALQQPDDPTFSFVADNQAKGISPVPAVTFHTSHALSAELWDADDATVADRLLPAAATVVAPATIVEHRFERWRYAGPLTPHPERCVTAVEHPGPLLLAGDGFGGSKVEGAYLSGRAAADRLATA
ncbi:MAG: NAD(P)/FAD-dependent oxidoreductase [Acidimicrobiales bacterium]